MARRAPHFGGDVSRMKWPLRGYRRGHLLLMFKDGQWRWADSGRYVPRQSAPGGDRACARCGLWPGPDGADPCIGYIDGALAACCGHGLQPGYIKYPTRMVRLPLLPPEPGTGPSGYT